MSEARLAAVRRAFGLFSLDPADIEATRELFAPEPEIVPLRAALEGTSYRGVTAIDDFRADVEASWSEIGVAVEQLMDAPPHVAVTGTRIKRLRTYTDEAGAMRDAGIGLE